jgi:hypothetical protein
MKWTNNRIHKTKKDCIRIRRIFSWVPRTWGTKTIWLEMVPIVERMSLNSRWEWAEVSTLGDFISSLNENLPNLYRSVPEPPLNQTLETRSTLFFSKLREGIPNFYEYFHIPAPVFDVTKIMVTLSCTGSSYTPYGFRGLIRNSVEKLSFISE